MILTSCSGSAAIDFSGNYVVMQRIADILSNVTLGGVRTEIFHFPSGTYPAGLAVDSSGNYIVVESGKDKLSKVTPEGVRTVVEFHERYLPFGVAVAPVALSAAT